MSNLLKHTAALVKAALQTEEAAAARACDKVRSAQLLDLHNDLADVAAKHGHLLGYGGQDLQNLIHTDGGGTPKI